MPASAVCFSVWIIPSPSKYVYVRLIVSLSLSTNAWVLLNQVSEFKIWSLFYSEILKVCLSLFKSVFKSVWIRP